MNTSIFSHFERVPMWLICWDLLLYLAKTKGILIKHWKGSNGTIGEPFTQRLLDAFHRNRSAMKRTLWLGVPRNWATEEWLLNVLLSIPVLHPVVLKTLTTWDDDYLNVIVIVVFDRSLETWPSNKYETHERRLLPTQLQRWACRSGFQLMSVCLRSRLIRCYLW